VAIVVCVFITEDYLDLVESFARAGEEDSGEPRARARRACKLLGICLHPVLKGNGGAAPGHVYSIEALGAAGAGDTLYVVRHLVQRSSQHHGFGFLCVHRFSKYTCSMSCAAQ